MIRTLLCSAIALVLGVGPGFAAEEKKPEVKKPDVKKPEGKSEKKPEAKPETGKPKPKNSAAAGVVKKFDPVSGSLVVTVKSKKESVDKDFTLTETVKVIVFDTDARKDYYSAKNAFKEIKEGAVIRLAIDPEGKVLNVQVGNPPAGPKTPKKDK